MTKVTIKVDEPVEVAPPSKKAFIKAWDNWRKENEGIAPELKAIKEEEYERLLKQF